MSKKSSGGGPTIGGGSGGTSGPTNGPTGPSGGGTPPPPNNAPSKPVDSPGPSGGGTPPPPSTAPTKPVDSPGQVSGSIPREVLEKAETIMRGSGAVDPPAKERVDPLEAFRHAGEQLNRGSVTVGDKYSNVALSHLPVGATPGHPAKDLMAKKDGIAQSAIIPACPKEMKEIIERFAGPAPDPSKQDRTPEPEPEK